MVQDAYPSDSDSFSPRGQPEVLDSTAGAVEISFGNCGAPEHMSPAALPAACDAQIDRRFFNSFQLEAPIEGRTGSPVMIRRLGVRLAKQILDGKLGGLMTDDHKVPRLHESHRTGVMGSGQEPRKNCVRNRGRQEILADITALKNRSIDGCPFTPRKLSVLV